MAGDGEFDFIHKRLLPLMEGDPAGLDLADDAALLSHGPGEEFVLACDTLIAGVHFLQTDAPAVVAGRALRSNLSDLAAMGATPRAYLSALSWPAALPDAWRSAFVDGLAREQARFGLVLVGGDTTATPGPLTISLTLVGSLPAGAALRRAGASVGEDVWVSGMIGDATLGLEVARGDASMPAACRPAYERPEPRLELGQALRGVATSAVDISDGLLADAGHIAAASRCRLVLDVDTVPVSTAASGWLAAGGGLERLLSGGDDYELLFTAPPTQRPAIAAIGRDLGLNLTRIGRVEAGSGLLARRADGTRFETVRTGFTHF
ncbi:thiamine-phosphate kinase [uncultured Maricaulis sp.]|uniref:thiamine-phosphate kinase n=1 Tax=uncultured Maricaulis sp. TaxID=174710 RepID=UPI0030D7E489